MGPSTLFRGILLLALGFGTHVAADAAAAAACTRSIKAVQGDTCASLAAIAGITVAQFLRSNPAVTSCSTLAPGSTYCLEGISESAPAQPSTTTTPVPTSGPLAVSSDGTCGPGVTCKGSRFGDCCSEHGFCGSTGNYCGDGCQAGLGVCGMTPEPTSSPTITPPPAQGTATVTTTITVTATTTSTNIVSITRASIVLQTQTSYIILTSTSTAVTTRTVIQSATAVATVTATATATATVTSTATALATATQTVRATVLTTSTVLLTSTLLSTSTAYRTVQTTLTKTNIVESTSIKIETLTTIKTVSVTVGNTIGCSIGGPSFVTTIGPGITFRPTPVITTITQLQPRPTPYLPGSSNSCKSYDLIQTGDTCRQLANRNDVSLLDFYRLNPSVSANRNLLTSLLCTPDLIELLLSGLCQIDCDNLWPGYFVCVG